MHELSYNNKFVEKGIFATNEPTGTLKRKFSKVSWHEAVLLMSVLFPWGDVRSSEYVCFDYDNVYTMSGCLCMGTTAVERLSLSVFSWCVLQIVLLSRK